MGRLCAVQTTALLETVIASVADDDVIEHVDTEQRAGSDEPPGQLKVVGTGRRLTAWMIVTKHDRRRIRQ